MVDITIRDGRTWHEHLILLLFVTICQDVSTLKRLWEEAEDVVDDKDSRLCVARTGSICLHAINGDPLALLLVTLSHYWRDSAASMGLRHRCVSPPDVEL